MKSLKILAISAMVGTLLVTATACGTSDKEAKTEETNVQLEGEVKIDGSTTVRPIMEGVSEQYVEEQPKVRAGVGGSGTGGGIKKLTNGEIDIADASRGLKEDEKKQLADKNINVQEFKLAFDGITIIVNKENDFAKDLTVEQLKKLWLEDGTTKKWSDIDPTWPNREVKFYSPTNTHGTYDYFDEVILGKKELVTSAAKSDDPNAIVTGVAGDKDAIGFLGYSYFFENKDKLKDVAINGIKPDEKTIKDGSYSPLSRPLYVYVNKQSLKEKPYVYGYVEYALTNAGQLGEDVGYIKMPQEIYDEQLKTLATLK